MSAEDKLQEKMIRAKINPYECLDNLKDISDTFTQQWQELRKNQIDALKENANIQFRLLAKVLPDMKSVEISNDPSAPVKFHIYTAEKNG